MKRGEEERLGYYLFSFDHVLRRNPARNPRIRCLEDHLLEKIKKAQEAEMVV